MRGRPLNHDDASCFDASRLSINKSVADFMKNMFSETAVLPEALIVILQGTGEGTYTQEKIE